MPDLLDDIQSAIDEHVEQPGRRGLGRQRPAPSQYIPRTRHAASETAAERFYSSIASQRSNVREFDEFGASHLRFYIPLVADGEHC